MTVDNSQAPRGHSVNIAAMTSNPRPRRRLINDTRFLVGLLLVCVSVAGVWFVVTSARQTIPVLQANRTILAGEKLVSSDFRAVDVSLGTVSDLYLTPELLTPGLVATRTLHDGELVPITGTSDSAQANTTTIVLNSALAVPAAVTAGSNVEVWHAPPKDTRSTKETKIAAPRVLLPRATVASVAEGTGVMSGAQSTLELVIDRNELADVLTAVSSGATLWVVPVGAGS